MKLKSLVVGVLFAVASVCSAQASVFNLLAFGQGWIRQDGAGNGSFASNNFIAGNCGANDCGIGEFRNFFRFDVSSISGPISSAVLKLNTSNVQPEQAATVGYSISSTSSLTFADLGTGTLFGSRNYTNADDFTVQSIALNGAGLAALLAGGTDFIISGRVTSPTLFGPSEANQFVFGSSFGGAELVVTTGVPEPSTWAMMLIGFAGLAFATRRKVRLQTA
jgi:hypothetical protein